MGTAPLFSHPPPPRVTSVLTYVTLVSRENQSKPFDFCRLYDWRLTSVIQYAPCADSRRAAWLLMVLPPLAPRVKLGLGGAPPPLPPSSRSPSRPCCLRGCGTWEASPQPGCRLSESRGADSLTARQPQDSQAASWLWAPAGQVSFTSALGQAVPCAETAPRGRSTHVHQWRFPQASQSLVSPDGCLQPTKPRLATLSIMEAFPSL